MDRQKASPLGRRGGVALVACVLVALAACSGGGDDSAADAAATRPTSTSAIATTAAGSDATAAPATTDPPAKTTAAPTSAPTTTATTTTTTTTTAPPTTAPPPPPCQVVAVGDSVGSGLLRNGLGESLAGVGCELGWSGGYPGITVADGAGALAGAGAVPANVAVVVLGYHNTRSETRSGRFPGLIDTVMEAAGPRLVVWPLLGRTPDCSTTYSEGIADADAELQAATARWPNLVLVDYPSVIGSHPEYAENRCPHLIPSGYRATALWLAGEVRRVLDSRPTVGG